jgi:hypothetical protein
VADLAAGDTSLITRHELNPILDNGCPRSAGGLENVTALALALNIPLILDNLDCKPFYHGYGETCSDAKLTIAIWRLPLVDLNGTPFSIPFYVVQGSGPLLVGNSILSCSEIKGPENLLVITQASKLSKDPCNLFMPTYTTSSLRTYLHVVPCRQDHMATYFSSISSFTSSSFSSRINSSNSRDCKRFALRLHGATHLSLADMEVLCKRSKVWTPNMQQCLRNAVSSCVSCQMSGRRKPMKKVSFSNTFREFNTHVQLDFFYIEDLNPSPVLHIRDAATGFSACSVQSSRDMDLTGCMFELCSTMGF